jgi:hypothetical protein
LWKKIECELKPSERFHHQCVIQKDSLILFGGINKGRNYLNDLWEFSFEKLSWSEIKTTGTLPSPKYGLHLVSIPKNELLLHGDEQIYFLDLEKSNQWETKKEFKTNKDLFQLNSFVFGGTIKDRNCYEFNPTMSRKFNDLPEDILVKILSFLDRKTICNVDCVSKTWEFSKASNSDEIWKAFVEKNEILTEIKNTLKKSFHEQILFMKNYKPKNESHKFIGEKLLKFCYLSSVTKKNHRLKIVVIGDTSVGKSCKIQDLKTLGLIMTKITGRFPIDYVPRVYDCKIIPYEIQKKKFEVVL